MPNKFKPKLRFVTLLFTWHFRHEGGNMSKSKLSLFYALLSAENKVVQLVHISWIIISISVCLETPRVPWMSSLSSSFWVPCQGQRGDSWCWFLECVPNPSPSSPHLISSSQFKMRSHVHRTTLSFTQKDTQYHMMSHHVTENQIDHICIGMRFTRSLEDVRVKREAGVASSPPADCQTETHVEKCIYNYIYVSEFFKSLEFDWTKFKALKSLNSTKYIVLKSIEFNCGQSNIVFDSIVLTNNSQKWKSLYAKKLIMCTLGNQHFIVVSAIVFLVK